MLDPGNWERFRADAHEMLDAMLDYVRDVRERPVWQPVPQTTLDALKTPLPEAGASFADVYDDFAENILPYPTGNIHPLFFGWVHGSGTPAGMLAELFAGAMNANSGGRDHAAVYVERQIIHWFTDLFGFGPAASGILLGGTSMANFAGVLVARTAAGGAANLTGYASAATHDSMRQAFSMAGLGGDAMRIIPAPDGRIDIAALERALADDRAAGMTPFLVVGNAGTVDTGAVDPLDALGAIAKSQNLWFHVDGAFGAMLALSEKLRPRIEGIERADSIAFDFHKWAHVQYDAACLLVRDEAAHRRAFASGAPYLKRMARGTGGGTPWFADYGPDLSRGFRALKIWFTFKHFGTRQLATAIEMNCAQAASFAGLVAASPDFELAAFTGLNIVCFRHARIAAEDFAVAVQESGRAVVSTTTLDGRPVLRACFTNHRTTDADVGALMEALKQAAVQLST